MLLEEVAAALDVSVLVKSVVLLLETATAGTDDVKSVEEESDGGSIPFFGRPPCLQCLADAITANVKKRKKRILQTIETTIMNEGEKPAFHKVMVSSVTRAKRKTWLAAISS